MNKGRLLYFVTEDWFFCSHWMPFAIAAKDAGYEVAVLTRVREHGDRIRAAGLQLIPLEISRRRMNPMGEIRVLWQIIRIYRTFKPDIVHNIALKPMIYGSIAAYLSKIPAVVNAMTGMGFLFISNALKARLGRLLVMPLYRVLLNRPANHLILENPDDLQLLRDRNILKTDQVTLIRGAGVDSALFTMHPEPEETPLVVLASRLLWDKGIGEFVEAARILMHNGVSARFALVGGSDFENPAAIQAEQLQKWREEGAVELWGYHAKMHEVFGSAHIVCLPSYREGLPKVLLEAAACGRPIVTTDVPGCREVVNDGVNGLLVPPRDGEALAKALKTLIESKDLRQSMGLSGRERIEKEFTHEDVNAAVLQLYEKLLR